MKFNRRESHQVSSHLKRWRYSREDSAQDLKRGWQTRSGSWKTSFLYQSSAIGAFFKLSQTTSRRPKLQFGPSRCK